MEYAWNHVEHAPQREWVCRITHQMMSKASADLAEECAIAEDKPQEVSHRSTHAFSSGSSRVSLSVSHSASGFCAEVPLLLFMYLRVIFCVCSRVHVFVVPFVCFESCGGWWWCVQRVGYLVFCVGCVFLFLFSRVQWLH